MKRLLSAVCATLLSSQAIATPVYHPYGPNLTYGAVSNGQTIMSDITNPASGAATMDKNGGGLRFGVLSNVGIGFELGAVDDMYDELDLVIDDLSNNFANVDNTNAAEVEQSVINANDLLSRVQDDGYAKAFLSFNVPLMPIVINTNTLGGSLVFDVNFSGVAKMSAFSDPINFTGVDVTNAQNFITANLGGGPVQGTFGDLTIDINGTNVTYDVDNDSSLVARVAGIGEAALGYSTEVMPLMGGKLFAGVRGKYYRVTLLQDAERVSASNTNSEDYFDDLDYDDGETSTGFGVDFGVLWVSDHLRAGATITNINEPEFEYNDFNVTGYSDPTVLAILNELSDEPYIMERQITVEAALTSQSKNWVIAGSLDLNEVMGPTGDEYQWLAVSASYATDNWLIPGFRAGYRVNQAGSELKYLTGGVTWANLNLDVAYSPDKVEDDSGDEISRSIMVNLGLELTF